jgi:hypothetical protein
MTDRGEPLLDARCGELGAGLRALMDSIDTGSHAGLRARALIGIMVYSFARIGAALGMAVEEVFAQNRRLWVRRLLECAAVLEIRSDPGRPEAMAPGDRCSQHRHLGRPTSDIDDHRAGRLGRQAGLSDRGADGGSDRCRPSGDPNPASTTAA